MDIITSTIIVAQNQEGKLSKAGYVADQASRNRNAECVSRGFLKTLGIGKMLKGKKITNFNTKSM